MGDGSGSHLLCCGSEEGFWCSLLPQWCYNSGTRQQKQITGTVHQRPEHLVLACCCFLVDCMYMTSNSAIRYGPDRQVLFCSRATSVAIQDSLYLHQQKCFVCGPRNWRRNCTGISAHLWVFIIANALLILYSITWVFGWACKVLYINSLQDACGCFDSPPAMRFAMAVNCTQPSNLSPFLSQTLRWRRALSSGVAQCVL